MLFTLQSHDFCFYWCILSLFSFIFSLHIFHIISSIFFFIATETIIIISLAIQPADMFILQKEQSPTAQHQQIILCKSSFPHLEPLFYATETHKLMQVKVEFKRVTIHIQPQKCI